MVLDLTSDKETPKDALNGMVKDEFYMAMIADPNIGIIGISYQNSISLNIYLSKPSSSNNVSKSEYNCQDLISKSNPSNYNADCNSYLAN